MDGTYSPHQEQDTGTQRNHDSITALVDRSLSPAPDARSISTSCAGEAPTICRLSSHFDEIVFQSFRERLRRGGFLWSGISEQRCALSCWEIGLEV
jgi:hypothetical protein